MPVGSLLDGFTPARLVARAEYFARDASVILKLVVTEQSLFAGILGFLLIALLVATSRLSEHRTPFALFCLAVIAGINERIIDIFWVVNQYDEWVFDDFVGSARLFVARQFMAWLCDVAFGTGVLALLMDRAVVAGISSSGRILALGIIVGCTVLPLVLLVVVCYAQVAKTIAAFEDGRITYLAYRTRLLELERFIYGHCSLYGAMCICLLVFSVVVYLKVSRHRPQGKRPAKVVCFVIAPTLVCYFVWRAVFAFADFDEGDVNPFDINVRFFVNPLGRIVEPFDTTVRYFVNSLGRGLVYIILSIVVLVMGFNRSWWYNDDGKTWPTVTPQTLWMYPAPLQQPQIQTAQPGVGLSGTVL